MLTCHAVGCENPVIPGKPQCLDHWQLLPAKVQQSDPWSTHTAKVHYVKRQQQIRRHHCHWPGCDKQVPPAMWGCLSHWRKLPKMLRDELWGVYRPGQELTQTPSRSYVETAYKIQMWIANYEVEQLL